MPVHVEPPWSACQAIDAETTARFAVACAPTAGGKRKEHDSRSWRGFERNQFQEQWLDANDNLLQWQLRALEAEKQGTRLPHPS